MKGYRSEKGQAAKIGIILVAFCVCMLVGCELSMHRIGGGPPPHAVAAGHRPKLELIPEAGVHYACDVGFDLFLYDNSWFKHSGDTWYVSSNHAGPWKVIVEPPSVFLKIPPGHAKHHVVKFKKGPLPKSPKRKGHRK